MIDIGENLKNSLEGRDNKKTEILNNNKVKNQEQ